VVACRVVSLFVCLCVCVCTNKVQSVDSSLLQCVKLKDDTHLALKLDGDVVIGGLFPLHFVAPKSHHSYRNKPKMSACSGFDNKAFRWMMTMVFAVEEINSRSDLLPGVKLGYRITDCCDSIHTGLNALFSLISVSEVVTTQLDSPTCLSDSPIPVSYFSTCTCLNDEQTYPSFLRTVPSDFFQVEGLVQLVTFFGWFWVGAIGTTDDYSRYGIQEFSNQFRLQGGCVEYHLTIPPSPAASDIQKMADIVQSSTAQVVVVFSNEGQLLELFSFVRLWLQWIASEAWVTASFLTSPHFHHLLEGTLGFSFPGIKIPGLEEFLLNVRPSPKPGMELINMFWEEQFGCKIQFDRGVLKDVGTDTLDDSRPVCTGSEDLSLTSSSYTDLSQVSIFYNVYKAVFAIAHALHALLDCKTEGPNKGTCDTQSPFTSKLSVNHFPVSKGSTECIKCPEFFWSDPDKVKCVAGVEEFLSFTETMGIILVTLTLLGVILTIIITAIFHHFRTTPIVKANNSEISFLLLLSLKLCFLCSLVFVGQPSAWTCMFRQAAFGISFVICLSCLLVKTIVVLLAFRANVPGPKSLRMFGPSQQRTLIFCTTAPQICLCTGWLWGAPPFPFRNPTYQALKGRIVLECKEPWPPGFYLVLGYIGLLAFVCLLLAFLGRKLPDTFNEAKFITFSMLIFIAVWISFIPAYVSSPGKFSVAVEIFAILASSFGLLLCIFVPKCYIILLHPERNIKKGMTGKYNRSTYHLYM
uniref:Olfactory receptor C family, u1 n=1 Tax=Nothobranchius furzeri TaxID=105023 RepID=A0A8C6KAF1_NOTFU